MTNSKYNKVQQLSNVGKYPTTFETCFEMIPEEIRNKLNYKQLAQMIDIIHDSFENGANAQWEQLK